MSKTKNTGKHFEEIFKRSVPDYCYLQRIPDPPQSFTQRSDTRFSVKNPYDYLMFDCLHRILYCVELKTTKYRSVSFEKLDDISSSTKMIHRHQILGLQEASEYDNVVGCFVFNFRDEKNNEERTYFQNIKDFLKMYKSIDKSSFNEMDLILNGAIKISGEKLRVNYKWDIDSLLSELGGK